jgi:uncharacterized Zn-binding protein involved in type VI secretion
MPEAARSDDAHECHFVEGNHPHRGGPIEWVADSTVMTGHLPQARAGDRCRCEGAPGLIVTGSGSVYVDGKPAARKGDRTMHPPPGQVTSGCDTVFIGGRPTGASAGGGVPARAVCQQAAATRESGDTMQSYGNCGVESVRQILNLRGREPISETAMLNDVIANGEAGASVERRHHGGSTTEENVRTLTRHGVTAQAREMTFQQILYAVAEGRGVITNHRVEILWGPGEQGRHAVLVTDVNYDSEGRLQSVVINDTGWGECSMRVRPDVFERSLVAGGTTVVTDRPIW